MQLVMIIECEKGIYQGIIPTLARDIPANALYFGSYEATKRFLAPSGDLKALGTPQVPNVKYWL